VSGWSEQKAVSAISVDWLIAAVSYLLACAEDNLVINTTDDTKRVGQSWVASHNIVRRVTLDTINLAVVDVVAVPFRFL